MFNLKNKLAIVAFLLMVTTNPLVAVHVNDGVNWIFNQIIAYSGYVSLVALFYIVGLAVFYYRRATMLNMPVKTSKTKTKSGLKYELSR